LPSVERTARCIPTVESWTASRSLPEPVESVSIASIIFLQSFVRVFQGGTPVCQLKLSASTVVSAARAAIGMILTQVVTGSRSQKLSDADATCVRAEGSPSHVIFL